MSWENIKSIIDGSRNFEKLMKLFKPTIEKTFKAIAFKVIFCGVMAWICLCPPFFYLLNPEYANDREYILHQISAFVLIYNLQINARNWFTTEKDSFLLLRIKDLINSDILKLGRKKDNIYLG